MLSRPAGRRRVNENRLPYQRTSAGGALPQNDARYALWLRLWLRRWPRPVLLVALADLVTHSKANTDPP